MGRASADNANGVELSGSSKQPTSGTNGSNSVPGFQCTVFILLGALLSI